MTDRSDPTAIHPALIHHAEERAERVQNRIADAITRFAGSMPFVYVHALWFGLWIGLGAEPFPYGLLTMLVSLEAIFLSTFVMLSQNRAEERRTALANHHWSLVRQEEGQNEELLAISREILELIRSTHDRRGRPAGT